MSMTIAMRRLIIILLMILNVLAFAKEKPKFPPKPYDTGTLLAFGDNPSPYLIGGAIPANSVIIQRHSFYIAIAIDDLAYTASTGKYYMPSEMIIGDPIPAVVDGKFIYFRLPNGVDFRAVITQRARYKSPTPPGNIEAK